MYLSLWSITINLRFYIYREKIDRYLCIGNANAIDELSSKISLPNLDNAVWKLLEIVNGIPYLESMTNEYVPQMLNMQAIDGISFTKGCYLGQETVARMQYLGKNKKAMFSLEGTGTSSLVVEKQLGENWRKAGDVTSVYVSDSGKSYVQAVLASDTEHDTKMRYKDDSDSSLSLAPLPYEISNNND